MVIFKKKEVVILNEVKRVKTIYGDFAVNTIVINKAINDNACTIHVLTGDCWVNPLGLAVADATAIKLKEGMILDTHVMGNLSLISNATGATVQIIVWR